MSRPVSARLLRTLRGSHKMVARARVCAPGQTGTNPVGTEIEIIDGNIVANATADVRATLDLTTEGAGMWPGNPSSLLAPYGNEVFVERGVEYGDGTTELVSQGFFRLYAPEQDVVPDGPIRLDGRDRMSGIIDARLLAPWQFTSTTTRAQVVSALVLDVYPWATIQWDDAAGDVAIGRTLIAEDDDRYKFLNDLVVAAGKIWYWDYRGVLVIKTAPAVSSPVFSVNQGEGGVLVDMSRDLSREGVYNAVVATGEGADTTAPARAVAFDNDPNSPTYFYGPFGKVPRTYSSSFITTNTQALSAATAILQQSLGVPYNVDFSAIPHPGLEPFDPVTVAYPVKSRSRISQTETHVLDQITLPLTSAGAMTSTTREQTLVTVGVG